MRTAIIIPARLAASRLPGKPLERLGDLPLVVRVARQARKCRGVDAILVATDAPQIFAAVQAHGERAIMTRGDHPSGTDRIAEVARGLDVDLIINLQGDEPFIHPADLDAVIQRLKAPDAVDMVTLKVPLTNLDDWHNPNVVKVVCRDDGLALYFSRASIPFNAAGATAADGIYKHVGVYGYRRAALLRFCAAGAHPLEKRERLEQLRALAIGMNIAVISAQTAARGIDTADDLAWARAQVARLGEAAFP